MLKTMTNKVAIYLNVFGELMTKGGYYAKDDDKSVIVFSIIASFCNLFLLKINLLTCLLNLIHPLISMI